MKPPDAAGIVVNRTAMLGTRASFWRPITVRGRLDQSASKSWTCTPRLAAALRAADYFGPFGIDAFRYRSAQGDVLFNPRCEINARFTMGYPRALMLQNLEI